MKNVELISFASADELARAVAVAWLDEIGSAQRARKSHSVALSGGRIAQKLFTVVVAQVKSQGLSLEGEHFFWADERCVPPRDPESNFRIAREELFVPLGIPADHIHRVRGEDIPEKAAKAAEADLRSHVTAGDDGGPVIDLVLLGMGEDGHVASLFPGQPEDAGIGSATYKAVKNSPKPPPNRVSLTYRAIAGARMVWVLASGAGKEAALRESLIDAGKTPLAGVIRSRSSTKIFTDIPVK